MCRVGLVVRGTYIYVYNIHYSKWFIIITTTTTTTYYYIRLFVPAREFLFFTSRNRLSHDTEFLNAFGDDKNNNLTLSSRGSFPNDDNRIAPTLDSKKDSRTHKTLPKRRILETICLPNEFR